MSQHAFKLIHNKLIVEVEMPTISNELFSFEAVFDTGAGKTVISENLANYLGLNNLPAIDKPTLSTASGSIKAKVVLAPVIRLFGQEFRNIEVAIVKLPSNIMVSGLIGINLMYLMNDFCINFKTKTINF
jgi:predicted aspartyl protease